MYKTIDESIELANGLKRELLDAGIQNLEVVVCPVITALSEVSEVLIDTEIKLGAQDCFWQDKGAFTGQASPLQLKDLGVKYCIIGHSEKRGVGESDEQINAKLKALLVHQIQPILCVGFGTTVEQDDLEVTDVLKTQLETDLADLDASHIVVAYEPVWAIGTGRNASPEHAESIAIFIKTKYGAKKVLYGGSVNAQNAGSFIKSRLMALPHFLSMNS